MRDRKSAFENIAAAAAFFALGAFWYAKSFAIKVTALNSSVSGSPRTFPQIISVLMMAVSLILIAENLIAVLRKAPEADAEGAQAQESAAGEKMGWKPYAGVAVEILASILYCVFIGRIGYLPASIALMAIVCWCFEIRRPLPLILLSVLVPGLLFAVFRFLLVVPLP